MKNRTTSVTTGPKNNRTTENSTNSPLMQTLMLQAESDRLNAIPFKNSSINVFDKKRYDISREFDGQEVDGTLSVRPTLSGGTMQTERFDMPGGGTNMSRTRMNDMGEPMKRVVRDKKIN